MRELWQQCVEQAAARVAAVKAAWPNSGHMMAGGVDMPPERDMAKESRETLQAQIDLAPDLYKSEAEWRPKYNALQMAEMKKYLFGEEGDPGFIDLFYNQVTPAANKAISEQRESEISDVERLGPRAVAAMEAMDPTQAALRKALNEQVLGDLEAGGELTADELRQVQQQIRRSQAARGRGYGPSDALEESMGTYLAGNQLKQSRRGMAMQLLGVNASTGGVDPGLAVLGRAWQGNPQASSLLGQSQAAMGSSGPRLFDPWSSYASQLYGQNYDAATQAAMAEAENKAGIIGGAMSAAGSILGGI
jgi:hypothetical protein